MELRPLALPYFICRASFYFRAPFPTPRNYFFIRQVNSVVIDFVLAAEISIGKNLPRDGKDSYLHYELPFWGTCSVALQTRYSSALDGRGM